MKYSFRMAAAIAGGLLMAGSLIAAPLTAREVDTAAISAAPANDWLSYGRDYAETRYSPLDQINTDSVPQLGLSWWFDTDFSRGLEASPIVVDGVMYLTGNWSVVYALDARTGRLLWRYDPEVPKEWGKMACCDVVNRGVALYEGKVFVGTLDARLIALDAATGQKIWETQTADTERWPYTITGAPRVAKGKVFIGNGGAEYGVRGFVSAYDTETGERLWRFYTVPGNPGDGFENDAMARAAETWTGQWWQYGGGGTVWDSIVYDLELDRLYIGVGNGSPWNRNIRSPEGGDNLYLSSIVALDPDTGEYLWHYQETPAESWDYTATQPIMLADIEWQGSPRKVIWHAPKNGFFFVIDRESGQLLSAEPFVDVNWASHYDLETGRPVETEKADYKGGETLLRPSSAGAHNWHPMAYHPGTGLVYIPIMESPFRYQDLGSMEYRWGHWNLGTPLDQGGMGNPELAQALVRQIARGALLAWNPLKQQAAWRVDHRLAWNGGVLATGGGLVVQGTADHKLLVLDAATGEELWRFDSQDGIMAPPVTYSIDGEQYISVLAGWGGAFGLIAGIERGGLPEHSRVLTFRLGGKAELPPLPQAPELSELPPRPSEDPAVLKQGRSLYLENCSMCHGQGVVSNGRVPDLRRLPQPFYTAWDSIVLDGAMRKLGMVGFADVLDREQSHAIKAYVLDEAHKQRELEQQPGWWRAFKSWFYGGVARVIAWLTGLATAV